MILAFLTFFVISIDDDSQTTIFCVCENSADTECKSVCKGKVRIGFTPSDIKKGLKDNFAMHAAFVICGTTEDNFPSFDLHDIRNITAIFRSATMKKEYMSLREGTAGKTTRHLFTNLNVKLVSGHYDFCQLDIRQVNFLQPVDPTDVSFTQKTLSIDFSSLASLPKSVNHHGPSHGLHIMCNESVDSIQFGSDHHIVLGTKSGIEAHMDLSQIVKGHNTTIQLCARLINMTFSKVPTRLDEIPRITFVLRKSAHIFINSDQFPDETMHIPNINFLHRSRAVYFDSPNGTIPPTFKHEGSGTVFKNNQMSIFYNHYCICDGAKIDCENKCKGDRIVSYDIESLDQTVVGNPSKEIKYVIFNSKSDKGKHPIFDLEHFGNRILTVIGGTDDEHIEFTGDATDDIGSHSFTRVKIHGKHLLFPEVFLHDIKVDIPDLSENETYVINATYLKSDILSLQRLNEANISFIAPIHGYEIHTNNLLRHVSILLHSQEQVQIENIVFPLLPHTTMNIFCGGSLSIERKPNLHNLRLFPKLRIYLEGDYNSISFPKEQWPESLSDISAKMTLVHGVNDVYVVGNYDGQTYKTKPPIVSHEGSGAIYFNGELSNFKSSYCICGSDNPDTCYSACDKYGSIINCTSEDILSTAIGNPTRNINYYVVETAEFGSHPLFDTVHLIDKSFTVIGVGASQYISLQGSKEYLFATTSVSHIFTNVNIKLKDPGFYFFNNVEFTKCSIYKGDKVDKGSENTYNIVQSGLTADMFTLKSLKKESNGLIYPSKLYFHANGGKDLVKVQADDSKHITVFDNTDDDDIQIDISMLTNAVQITTSHGYSIDDPFIINIDENAFNKPSEIPKMLIDVSNVEGDDAFVKFTGRKWKDGFHNLTDRVTIVHGQLNIHLLSKQSKSGKYTQQPPHVTLDGDGDYYINLIKQASVFAPGNHENGDDDDEPKTIYIFTALLLVLAVLTIMAIAAYYSPYWHRPGEMKPSLQANHNEHNDYENSYNNHSSNNLSNHDKFEINHDEYSESA
ncbi:hypothetical protein TRFO_42625 [Tritrichomonas foetus]|uniref:IPT/TIG domain-containing protein n=1 Tax=Tritrichomonas foetus TaxID=1144522 RepID=A0A1J4KVU5_9EUKA|nr:hypothetical protein TRFO_42625 [Tritrichomonas foetus]|eukprot:OHT15266.1 hypothetical protein TRFO_42625 [Tritrichomonas foetus]